MKNLVSRPSATVIVCAYTRERFDDILAAVDSVEAQGIGANIIVVVDHNDDLLEDLRIALAQRACIVQPSSEPKGLSGARNTGTLLTDDELVLFLDDDATADNEWLPRLLAPFTDPSVVAVGGRAIPRWPSRPKWFPNEFLWVIGCSHEGLPTKRSEIRNVIGCNMAFRRDAVIAAGGFRTNLGRTASTLLGAEETELCIRITQANPRVKIIYEPAAVVRHRVADERVKFGYFLRRCYAEGLSKAHMVRIVGSEAGLDSERTYVYRTLPRGILRAFIADRKPSKAVAILAGLLATGYGYIAETTRYRLRRAPSTQLNSLSAAEEPTTSTSDTGRFTQDGITAAQ